MLRCLNTGLVRTQLSDEQKSKVASGPGLEDFLTGSIHVEDAPTVPEHLKKKKGQHLRLPEWLKTEIPIGKNYTRLKDSLRKLKLNTVGVICVNVSHTSRNYFPIVTVNVLTDVMYCKLHKDSWERCITLTFTCTQNYVTLHKCIE